MATVVRPVIELSDVLKRFYDSYQKAHQPNPYQRRIFTAISQCRTEALGGHVDQCTACGHQRNSYNSCRNRHCPKCQAGDSARWIEARQADLLPVRYFHVVFTLPEQLNVFCLEDPRYFYKSLFDSSVDTLLSFGHDHRHLGAQMGLIGVLHTWGQNLSLHPHVHFIVPAGGITETGHWKNARSKGTFLFPQKALAQVFKAKFLERWIHWHKQRKRKVPFDLRRQLYDMNWVVYAKQPFGGPEQVVEYLSRYTHKVAISNHRLKQLTEKEVIFQFKDYRNHSRTKLMQLSGEEFLRRFSMHFLPSGFHRMRHYGFLSNRNKGKLKRLQMQMGIPIKKAEKLNWKQFSIRHLNFDPDACPRCKTGRMTTISVINCRAPPKRESAKLSMISTQF